MAGSLDEFAKQERLFVFRELENSQAGKLMNVIATFDRSTAYVLIPMHRLEEVNALSPHLVIMYYTSNQREGNSLLLDEVRKHLQISANIPLVVITDTRDLDVYRECYTRGVKGLLHTSMQVGRVKKVLHLIANGGTFVPEVLLKPKA